jgi:hypothetical protein
MQTHLSTSKSISLIIVLALCLSPVLGLSASAQTTVTGAVEGDVRNSAGAGVGGIVVQFINEETEVIYPVRTDANGHYVKNQLPPGRYNVRILPQGDYKLYPDPDLQTQKAKNQKATQNVFITETLQHFPDIVLEQQETAAAPTPTPTGVTSPTSTPTPATAASTAPVSRTPGNEEKEVEDIRATINTRNASRGGGFSDDEVRSLPLGSVTRVRTFDELALYLPGVAPPPQTQGDVAGPGVGAGVGSAGQFAVNGLRSRANNFTMDGSDNNDEDIGVRRQGFLALVPQPVESIKEYHIITLLAPAQFGRNIGAQVDAVSKSGGNETHGTLFGFFNSSQLNSRDFFDTANGNAVTALRAGNNQPVLVGDDIDDNGNLINARPITVRNESGGKNSFTLGQFGLVLGGPLVPSDPNNPKGHSLFYYVAAEGHILNANKEVSFAVPTVEQRGTLMSGASGLFRNPFTCQNPANPNTCTGGALDFYYPTTSQGDAIFSLFPFPNNPTGVYGRNTLTQLLPASGRSKIASGKFDASFGAFNVQHQLTGRYNFTDDFRDIPATGGAIFSTLRPNVRTQNFSTFLSSQITDRVANEFRASYGRTRLNFQQYRRPEQLPSDKLPNTPFLLNTRLIQNFTFPAFVNGNFVANTGPVLYVSGVSRTENGSGLGTDVDRGALGPIGQVIIAGFSPVGVDVFNFPQNRVNNTYQVADTMSLSLRHRHSVAFGTDIRRVELNSELPRNSRTLITFNGAPRLRFDQDPETGDPSNFRFQGFFNPTDLAAASAASGVFQTLAAPGSSSTIGLRYYQYYFFGQDEWRVRPNLSISYGLRYEYSTPPREVHQLIENTFSSPSVAQLLPNLRQYIAGRTGLFDPDRNNFAPRVGFAYSPRPSTVIRAGYGLFYDQVIGAVVSQSRNTFPNFLTLNSAGGLGAINGGAFSIFNFASVRNGILFNDTVPRPGCGPFSNTDPRTFCVYTLPGGVNNLNPSIGINNVIDVNNREFPQGGFGVTLPARNLPTPMAQHYALTVEQQVGRNTVVSVAYVGTQGRHLLRLTTPNLGSNPILLPLFFDQTSIVPTFGGLVLAPGATVDRNGNIVGGRPTGGVGSVNIYETTANSRYDALQVQVRGRFARRMQYQANYTFSRAEDDASDVFDLAGSSALPQDSRTRAGERADSNFDARHQVAYTLNYTLPSFADHSHAFRSVFGGLELASDGQFRTGQPFTVNSIFDVNLDGNLTDRPNTTNGIIVTGNRQQPLRLASGVDPTSLLAPIGQDGSVPRNAFRASNLLLFNVAVTKRFHLRETTEVLFRTEVFNLTNRANFGIPVRFLEAPGFGQATDTVTPGRRVQFALKLSF